MTLYKTNELRSHLMRMFRLIAPRSANACIVLVSNSCQTLAAPSPDGQPKEYPQKIVNLVDNISQLTLLEVADLNELLKVMY